MPGSAHANVTSGSIFDAIAIICIFLPRPSLAVRPCDLDRARRCSCVYTVEKNEMKTFMRRLLWTYCRQSGRAQL
ncbi:hypothetical protein BKA82DRAFT_4143305, partial [Pisolithus tinctorius]